MSGRRNTSRTLAILAGITVVGVGAIFVVSQLRSETPSAGQSTVPDATSTTVGTSTTVQPTTTIPSVVLEPRGEPFQWTAGLEVVDQTPVALLEHEGTVYLFTGTPADENPDFSRSTGLQVWAWAEGADWDLRSVIEDTYEVHSVISSSFGLVAAGFDSRVGTVWCGSPPMATPGRRCR